MRNLKKFLALVMAMVMALSLMITVNAANPVKDFDDFGNVTKEFQEAADVLTGMKVFQGDEGGFRPADTINRAEVAALIYRLATGDVDNNRAQLYANYGNFDDVNESDWFAGYVGYCANAGYIKGTTPTTFDPYAPVTGYETLAMILRAIGYDKNGEFTGTTWQTNVSALATQLGILENIKTTHYGDTLYLASRRDVVAELLFQADATVPMVTYTTAFGYQQTGMTGGVVGATTNPTLGLYIFGLTDETGIIVGNQETGERVTILGRDGAVYYTGWDAANNVSTGRQIASWTAYNYPGTPVVDGQYVQTGAGAGTTGTDDIVVSNSLFLNWKSGIDTFGHQTKFWYNGGENDGTKLGNRDNPRKVYAAIDKSKAEKLVWAADGDLTGAGLAGTATASLGNVVKANDMVISGNKAIFNTAFDRMTYDHYTGTAATTAYGSDATTTITNESPISVYKIISNHTNVDDKNVLDLVIALNIQSSKVSGVDNVSSFKYVTVPDFDDDDGSTWVPEYLVEDNLFDHGSVTGLTTGFIAQSALVGDSVKTLGANVIGWHITGTWSQNTVADGGRRNVSATGAEATAIAALTGGTAADVSKAYYKLAAVGTKEGAVVSYHNDAANIPGSGYVLLSDGTRLNQSVLYNTVQDDTTNGLFTIPQQNDGTADTACNQMYGNMTYRFYLDAEGNYVGAEPIMGTEFVYGTYIDFESNLGTSTYTYRLVGVNMNGEMVTKDVSRWSNTTFQTAATQVIGATGKELDTIGIPFRGDHSAGSGTTGVQDGKYMGFAVNSSGVMNEDIGNANATNLAIPMYTGDTTIFPSGSDPVYITSDDVTLGAKLISATAGAGNDENLFVTEATKFILVSGTGTDTQKVTVYNGIGELLGNNRRVGINFNNTSTTTYLDNAIEFAKMVVWSQSDYIYAQDATGTSKQADVIFIPAEAVSGAGSQLYYVGSNTMLMTNAYGRDATKFTMYVDGNKGEYWIAGLIGAADTVYPGRDAKTVNDNGTDLFYNLTDTGLKANDGQPIYTVDTLPNTATEYTAQYRSNTGYIIQQNYVATTKDAQTAMIGGVAPIASNSVLYRVSGAKVVNLNADNKTTATSCVWPGVTDLATLNQASSLNNVTAQVDVKVSCVLSSDNLTVQTIYVCWDQS